MQAGVDGHYILVLGNDVGIVGVVHRQQQQVWVMVCEVKEPLGADEEVGDDFAFVQLLAAVVDDAGLVEVDDALGENFGVDAQMFFIF